MLAPSSVHGDVDVDWKEGLVRCSVKKVSAEEVLSAPVVSEMEDSSWPGSRSSSHLDASDAAREAGLGGLMVR